MNILFIAPHADDEVLGCGATMAKAAKDGHNVYVLICTNANNGAPELFSKDLMVQVRNEARIAHQSLGVKETFFQEFPAPMLDQVPQFRITKEIVKVIRQLNIDTVYMPHRGDRHVDHTVIHDCAMVACRPLANNTVKHAYAYEALSETEWGEPTAANAFIPTKYHTFSVEEFEAKLHAMECFKTQLYEFPAARSLEAVEALGKYRGSNVSAMRAEAFEVLRDID
ncbi:MAG: PIG-L family deacetylase [Bacteroidaceae bacterium]|nr:PIG-L family deacetylase [Bacteroidaceae bacterium]